ncbi:MAG: nicotinate (nicotinamide) nucleotide adenylyltransferase [FCB group bacterium]|nr:nicotinate (nicotinamide) nucleotide adenylyltransferase [FCB group bacterium]
MTNICLFGGAFDPVHKGHLHFAEKITALYQPDVFFFIPTRYSPFKGTQKFASDSHRLNMLEAVTHRIPHAKVSRIEIEREGISYSLDTLKFFQACYPGHRLFWVIGEDHLPLLDTWKGYPEHFSYCDFIILPRQFDPETNDRIAAHAYREQLHLLSCEAIPVSSTGIRAAIAEGRSILSYVPKEINDYIHANKLYR